MTINRAIAKAVHQDFQVAMKEIADKYGLVFEPSRFSFNSERLQTQMKLNAKDALSNYATLSGQSRKEASASAALASAAQRHGLSLEPNEKGEILIGYYPNRHSYPWVFQGPRGGKWKLDTYSAQMKFSIKKVA